MYSRRKINVVPEKINLLPTESIVSKKRFTFLVNIKLMLISSNRVHRGPRKKREATTFTSRDLYLKE